MDEPRTPQDDVFEPGAPLEPGQPGPLDPGVEAVEGRPGAPPLEGHIPKDAMPPIDAHGFATAKSTVSAMGVVGAEELVAGAQVTLWGDVWYRLKRNRLAMAGLVVVIVLILVAVFAAQIAPYDPIRITSAQQEAASSLPPSLHHLMGTDVLGRDVFSRVVYGSRVSLEVGILAVGMELFFGLIAGAFAAYYGGWLDSLLMRIADVFFAFPYVLGAIALVAVMRAVAPGSFLAVLLENERAVFIAIGILGWPFIARVFRSSILTVRQNDYVEAARALGASDLRIILRHILPNAIAPVIVYGTMSVGGAIITEAALSFLGIGVTPPTPAWGYMLQESRGYIFNAPWLMYFPGLAILITVLAFVLLGDGLRDALDPRLKE
jgi:peptide/nickel transport system permease protein